MASSNVFLSFHYDLDVTRVQQIRNMGLITADPPVSHNDWETIKKSKAGVEDWIVRNISKSDCVIVLIGEKTYTRNFVIFEIKEAWNTRKPIFGIHIHGLKNLNSNTSPKGKNPFDELTIGSTGESLASRVKTYNPSGDSKQIYGEINANLEAWVENAIKNKR